MGIDYVQISLKNNTSDHVFFSGDKLEGEVIVRTKERIKIRGITLTVNGQASVHWSESRGENGANRMKKDYSAIENFLSNDIELVKLSNKENVFLEPGESVYPFKMQLPEMLPTSFETRDGRVRYMVTVNVDIPWAIDKQTTCPFTVIQCLDLNRDATLKQPVGVSDSKRVGFCGCGTAGLEFKLSLDKTGYVPGELFKFKVDVQNMTGKTVSELSVKIIQIIQLYAEGRSVRDRSDMAFCDYGRSVAANEACKWQGEMVVPPVSPSLKDVCVIIQIAYYGVLSFKVGSGLVPNALTVPLVIGSIPLNDRPRGSSNKPILESENSSGSIPKKTETVQDALYNQMSKQFPILD